MINCVLQLQPRLLHPDLHPAPPSDGAILYPDGEEALGGASYRRGHS